MMKLASINMRKSANNPRKAAALERWLGDVGPTMLMVQEPVVGNASPPPKLGSMRLLGGNAQVACWVDGETAFGAELFDIPALIIETATEVICNTYLSASSRPRRIIQLSKLRDLLGARTKPVVLVGDFNMAPDLQDGLYGDEPSAWTNAAERLSLGSLIDEIGAVDLLSQLQLGKQHFTLERVIGQKWSRFRCDLVYAPDRPDITASYDHSVRLGANAFTDHSACIVELGLIN